MFEKCGLSVLPTPPGYAGKVALDGDHTRGAKRVRIPTVADAEYMKIPDEAGAASHDRVALDRMRIG